MKKMLMAVGALALLSMSAAETARAQAYGAAGCGLGSIVFGNQPGIMQVLAATTNGTFFSQTFGITFGTSNCTAPGMGMVSAKAFIETNREAFAKDVSRGSGETIEGLATLAGCQDAKKVGATLQAKFKVVFPRAGMADTEVSQNAVAVLQADKNLACSNLI
jgi:hypothetical protein